MNITHLLNQLSRIKAKIEHNKTVDSEQMNLLRRTLRQYGKNTVDAIRDYKLMSSLSELPDYADDKRISLEGAFPYLARPYQGEVNQPYDTRYRTTKEKKTQSPDPIREILRKTLPNRLSWTEEEREARRPEYSAGISPETYSHFLDSVARFVIGTLGGCALIVPMVIMVFNPSLPKSLVVVSVAVVLFALILGMVFKTNNKDTIVTTATYAAVLVVFVGSSGSGAGAEVGAGTGTGARAGVV
ncbi:hypothetical protein K505DRAFT_287021 [Melanomma pulvis-pyrius CBS 109.77]|uniref:DUF6594 domain-containing protein n=1 Tax=Melanomma pulvis-pyrius CBS 109.77 TaxID=1314802 RepID=A0A6A6WVI8_9PLEO|nr:hypothetical protein K505DRAFT_287021 [Melanomma pulvis-pyrius CBS 109.77]